jgi:hypothetical protein
MVQNLLFVLLLNTVPFREGPSADVRGIAVNSVAITTSHRFLTDPLAGDVGPKKTTAFAHTLCWS